MKDGEEKEPLEPVEVQEDLKEREELRLVDKLEQKILKDNKTKKDLEALIDRESNYKLFLKSINYKSIPEDGHSKQLVEQVVNSKQNLENKVYDIKRIIANSNYNYYKSKIDDIGVLNFNTSQVDALNQLLETPRNDLSNAQIETGDFILKLFDGEFDRIGRAKLSQGIPQRNKEDLNLMDRLSFEHRKRINSENSRMSALKLTKV